MSGRRQAAVRRWTRGVLLAVGGFLLSGTALPTRAAEPLPPPPTQYVSDGARILSPATVAGLNARLDAFERETSNQIVVATFPALPADYAMEDFTNRTFEAWGVGRKDRNNGAALFIFPNERQMRIEVGYGLEGAIPDATAAAIIANDIRPAFRAGDYDAGVTRGVEALLAAARGEYQGTGRTIADAGRQATYSPESSPEGVGILIFILAMVVVGYLNRSSGRTYGRRARSHGGGAWLPMGGGGGFGGFGGGSGGGGGFRGGGGSSGGGGASGGW